MQKIPEEHQSEINKIFNKFSTFMAKMKQNFEDLLYCYNNLVKNLCCHLHHRISASYSIFK